MGWRPGKAATALLILFILMQCYQPKQGAGATEEEPQSIEAVYKIPGQVAGILERSCYDCHSNTTDYPWYSYVQPVGWWLEGHISEGKEELNFSTFGTYSKRRQASKLESVAGQVKAGSMPPESYALMHRDARLTEEEVQVLTQWVQALQDSLSVE